MSRSESIFSNTPLGREKCSNKLIRIHYELIKRPVFSDISNENCSFYDRTPWNELLKNAIGHREEDQTNPIWNRRYYSALVSKENVYERLLKPIERKTMAANSDNLMNVDKVIKSNGSVAELNRFPDANLNEGYLNIDINEIVNNI